MSESFAFPPTDTLDYDAGEYLDALDDNRDERDYPIIPDYCDCGQHVDEHDGELHNMRMDARMATYPTPEEALAIARKLSDLIGQARAALDSRFTQGGFAACEDAEHSLDAASAAASELIVALRA